MDRSLDTGQFYDEYAMHGDDQEEGDMHEDCLPMDSVTQYLLKGIALCASNAPYPAFSKRRHDPAILELADLTKPERHRMFVPKRRRRPLLFFVRTLFILLPCLCLMALGVIHALQALLGREGLLWNSPLGYNVRQPSYIWNRPTNGELMTEMVAARLVHVSPVPCHSHNDYWRETPLLEALSLGAISVEADVWKVDEELYVGHDMGSLTSERTFSKLYVEPLVELLNHTRRPITGETGGLHHHRHIFGANPNQSLVLLIDFKNLPTETWRLLTTQLEPLRQKGYLSHFDGISTNLRAITVVATGKAPFNLISSSAFSQDIFFDAPLDELWQSPRLRPISDDDQRTMIMDYGTAMAQSFDDDVHQNAEAMENKQQIQEYNFTNAFYASVSFKSSIGNVWRGHLSPHQMKIIRGHIRGARLRNLQVRYFHTPIWPISLRNHVWHVLVKEGADVLSVDDLEGCVGAEWRGR